MKSAHPNRFFGMNPVGVPNNGAKDVKWSHELPKDWRSAVAGPEGPPSLPSDDEEYAGDFDDG